MKSNRRLFQRLLTGRLGFERKVQALNTFFSITLFFLFLGFVVGNVFGTFLNGLRHVFRWDGYIILFVLSFIEVTNYGIYRPGRESTSFLSLDQGRCRPVWKICNFFKIGLMLGFFIDAFKVGS